MQKNKKTELIVFAGIFIALTIIFTHIFAIQTVFMRVSFGFLPIALFAMKFGRWQGAVMAAIADVLGGVIFFPGLLFPGFTLSAFCTGWIFGHFLHIKRVSLLRILIAVSSITLFVDLGLNTIWLALLYNKAVTVFFVSRLIKAVVFLPVEVFLIHLMCKQFGYFTLFQKRV